jgi:hypothetical protein
MNAAVLTICPEQGGNITTFRKSKRVGPTENPPPPALYVAQDQNLIGMLTGATPHYGPWPGGMSPLLRWSVIAVNLVGSGGGGEVSKVQPATDY